MSALYVEIDPFAAEWLRALVLLDHIAPGDVYCGSLEDLTPEFCSGYTQVHLCAGIGVWSLALRNAGWPDDRPVWTASFPCQPFSAAGQGAGFADERHLWPSGFWLIDQCRPVVLLGEQVASKPGLDWFDLVSTDLEGAGYTVGAHDLCAAGVGAPHIRQRLYFVAHASEDECGSGRPGEPSYGPAGESAGLCDASHVVDADGGDTGAEGLQRSGQHGQQQEDGRPGGGLQHAESDGRIERGPESERRRAAGGGRTAGRLLANGDRGGQAQERGNPGQVGGLQEAQRQPEHGAPVPRRGGGHGAVVDAAGEQAGLSGRARLAGGPDGSDMAFPEHSGRSGWDTQRTGTGPALPPSKGGGEQLGDGVSQGSQERQVAAFESGALRIEGAAVGPTELVRGRWAGADWIWCRDGKYRPVEPGTFPLAHGAPARVGRLRGFGNAIVAPVAEAFIEAVIECL